MNSNLSASPPGPPAAIKLTAVIPTYNRKTSLIQVLDTLRHQNLRGIALSVIVVVDGSTDGTQAALQSGFPEVVVIEGDGQWWWTRSVNRGCQQAVKNGAQAVLLLNDDVQLEQNYLQALITASSQHPGAIIGSLNITRETRARIFFSGARVFQWWQGKLQRYHPFLAPHPGSLSGLHKSIVLPGRGVLIPAAVFQRIGYFDEKNLPQYKADYELVLRAHKKKIPTLISWDAIVYVDVSATGKGATFTKQSLFTFFKSLFYKYSRTNLYQNFLYYRRFYPLWALPLFPVTVSMVIIRQFFLFIKGRKY